MSYPYRCSKAGCRCRKALPRLIDMYLRRPLCPACKRDSLKLDKSKRAESKRKVCNCDGLPYPHRSGSGLWCIHSTNMPTEQDYMSRYAGTYS